MTRQIQMAVLAMACAGLIAPGGFAADDATGSISRTPAAGVRVRCFLPVQPISRARRPAPIEAVIGNPGGADTKVTMTLVVPKGIRALTRARIVVRVRSYDESKVTWEVEADTEGLYDLELHVEGGQSAAVMSLSMRFLPVVEVRKLAYIPDPKPVKTTLLVGAHNCPLWESGAYHMWDQVLKHPERTPALGFYAQENPEVADWETKWAVEHGVDFFIYCWYRASQGEAVKMDFGSAIHDALLKSRFKNMMKFTIMWENQRRGIAGVANESDLMGNLLPFWINNYFKLPNYVKVDNKPLLFIYRPEFLIEDLGGESNVRAAFNKMREACKMAGFDGLYILGEYRGLDPGQLALMKRLGLDYTFAYCWYVGGNPTPAQAIDAQMGYIKKTQELGIMPQVVTVSQAWSGWNDEGSIWKIPPKEFEGLLRQAKDFVGTLPPNELGSKLLLLDNWNEWGEGHYIAPYREYEFGYLDAVRRVFSDGADPHVDLIPEDIGLGPYDTAFRTRLRQSEERSKLAGKRVVRPGADEKGLIGWWAFDEKDGSPVALDYSGHRLGGWLDKAKRAPGIDGRALLCDGGSVIVENNPMLSVTSGMTVECWAKTDIAGQVNTWMVNRVFSGGTSTGYRLGILDGNPCFEVPETDFSHHLKADLPLPMARWAHLAGTFDGKMMRIYVNGVEHGAMERPGPIKGNEFHLCLGNFEEGHPSYFRGLLDEVKLYNRALGADEVRAHYAKYAK